MQHSKHDYCYIIHQQVLQANLSITWRQCAEQLTKISNGKTTIIKGKVYCGGANTDDKTDEYSIFCYVPSQDKWTTLPPLPVRWFGLGQVNAKLVAVGGSKKNSNKPTNEVYTYEQSRLSQWKQIIPPMPTARHSPSVLSLKLALVVAGGGEPHYTAAVEIFKPDTSQWYRTDPLPKACRDISMITIGNVCYAGGGFASSHLNQALYVSIDDLLGNAVPANQTTHSSSVDTPSVWKTLPNTPTFRPALTVIADNLFVVGGDETSEGGTSKKEVYMYSPSTNSWIYISDLPAPRSRTIVAVLSSIEILVIGGYDDGRLTTVYKGALHLKL